MEVHTSQINDLKLNKQENLLVTASEDKLIRLFSLEGTNTTLLNELTGHETEVSSCAFISDDLLASADYLGNLIFWTRRNNQFVEKNRIQVCSGAITSMVSISTANEIKLVCGCFDGNIRIVNDKKVTEEIFVSEYGVSSLDTAKNMLLTGGLNFKVNLYDDLKLTKTFSDHKARVNDVAFCVVNENIICFASASSDKTVIIYQGIDSNHTKQVLELPEEVFKINFNKITLNLTVCYGAKQFKTFTPNTDGIYEEIECEEVTN